MQIITNVRERIAKLDRRSLQLLEIKDRRVKTKGRERFPFSKFLSSWVERTTSKFREMIEPKRKWPKHL